mmetsp:Transcript_7768/g.34529  ORF Transcript_7768/g.34529 Transcript_7768/m.34529 type:complete len:115 (+) Transcript_7768:1562-1906(+)
MYSLGPVHDKRLCGYDFSKPECFEIVHFCTREIAKHASGRNHRTMRFKGLGEMMATELWDTTMNPQKRVLRQVTVEDAMEAETMFSLLMGDNVLHRREYIQSRADEIELEELDI